MIVSIIPVDSVESLDQKKEGRHQDKDLSLQLQRNMQLKMNK